MILITSILVLLMVSLGHGSPMPEPNPDPNLIIQVRQVVHRRYCNKPHDEEGPYGHPTTVAGPTEVPVDTAALEAEKEKLEAEINAAKEELDETKEEVAALEEEVKQDEEELATIDNIYDELDNFLIEFRRKRASVLENVKDILGGLGDVFEEGHRSRRSVSSSDTHTLTYCPVADGEITGTYGSLFTRALADIKNSLAAPRDISLLMCVLPIFKDLKALNIQFSQADKDALKATANEAKSSAQTAKNEKEEELATKKANLETKKTEAAALEQDIVEKKEEAAELEAQIAANKSETTDPPATTVEGTVNAQDDIATAADILPATTEPIDV